MGITINGSSAAGDIDLGTNGTITDLAVGGLPDGTVDTDTLASSVPLGITEIDNWRVTSNLVGNGDPVSANWERVDRAPGLSKIGTGMSVSSGIWTFPSTGIWQVILHFDYEHATEVYYAAWALQGTADNSTYHNTFQGLGASVSDESSNCHGEVRGIGLFDITDTTQCKIKLRINSNPTVTWTGDTSDSKNSMMFIKLAET
jgi:hypothetical protein